MPEETFHLGCNLDVTAFIVNGRCRVLGAEHDTVLGLKTRDAPAETATVDEDMTTGASGAFPALPCFGEESLSLEVAVELICHLHLYVAEDILDDLVIVIRHRLSTYRKG